MICLFLSSPSLIDSPLGRLHKEEYPTVGVQVAVHPQPVLLLGETGHQGLVEGLLLLVVEQVPLLLTLTPHVPQLEELVVLREVQYSTVQYSTIQFSTV